MSPMPGGFVPERPVLLGSVRSPNQIKPTGRGKPKITLPGTGSQGQRLDSRFESAMRLFEEQVDLTPSIGTANQVEEIVKGNLCLVIKDGNNGSSKNYCQVCALAILDQAADDLQSLRDQLHRGKA